jgi:hypothetical protein
MRRQAPRADDGIALDRLRTHRATRSAGPKPESNFRFRCYRTPKTRYESSYEEDGVWVGDGFGNQMTLHCFGMEGRTDQTRHNRNFSVATDLDGDQIAVDAVADPYQNDSKEIRLTGTLAAGTGKYAGISGELKFVGLRGYYKSPTDGTFFAYATGKGHYQLPQ